MNSQKKFVHLHVHTDYSSLDGAGTTRKYAEKAVRLGYPALACTEHGTMRGIFEQNKVCKEFGLKPIFGTEFYVCNDMHRRGLTAEEKTTISSGLEGVLTDVEDIGFRVFDITSGLEKAEAKEAIAAYERKLGIKDRFHITVWAKNDVGLRNLYALSSMSFTQGYYYKPRIDIETLCLYGEGLMVGSGCLASKISRLHQEGDLRGAAELSDELYEAFGEDYYLEVQPHDIDDQRDYNKFLLQLRKRYDGKVKLLATQDSHYVDKTDSDAHDVLLCVGMHNNVRDTNRFRFDGNEFYYKSRDEMRESFVKYHPAFDKDMVEEALDTTLEVCEKANAELEVSPEVPYLPDVEVPEQFDTPYKYLVQLCVDGWRWRKISEKIPKEKQSIYLDRLKLELKTLKDKGFEKYFLVVYDLYKWVREQKIFAGPGRGSSAGSLVAYLLGITAVDPIEHELLFARFISPARMDLPDIDMDFEKARRHEIFEYLINKYGRDNVAQISTIGTLTGKSCFKDCCRVFEVPYVVANRLSDLIPENTKNAVQAAYDEFDEIKQLEEDYPGVIENAKKLEGLNKQVGIHAAGVVASPRPLSEILPIEIRKSADKENVRVVAFDKKATEKMGLVKLDVLGLKTLSVFKDTLAEIERTRGEYIDLVTDVPLDDDATLAGFTKRDFTGVFQFDSSTAFNICSGVKFDLFTDIVLMTSLNRPGANTMAPACKSIKAGRKKIDKNLFDQAVYDLTEKTYGFIVYQEQAMSIATNVAGYTPDEAEKLRKLISSSAGAEEMNKDRAKFVAGCVAKSGMKEDKANLLMDTLIKFGGYAFNLSHAVCYSVISYWCMWLKTHYPAEFFCGLLRNEENNDKQQAALADAAAHGINILPPDINDSKESFALAPEGIRYGFSDVKGIGDKACAEIVSNQPYESLDQLLRTVNRRKVNKAVVFALLKAGAFDKMHPEHKELVDDFAGYWVKMTRCHENELWPLTEEYLKGTLSKQERYLNIKSVMSYSFGLDMQVDKFVKEKLKVKFAEVDEKFFDMDRSCFIVGGLSGSKTHKIGDYAKEGITAEEKEQMFWGAQYASCEFTFKSGVRSKVKFDIDIYEEMIEVIKADAGTSVAIFCSTNSERKTITARFAVDLDAMMRHIDDTERLTYHEKILLGQHPMMPLVKNAPEKMKRAMMGENFKRSRGGLLCGVIINIRKRKDKFKRTMAFVGILTMHGFYEVTFFGKQWESAEKDFGTKKCMCIQVGFRRNDKYGNSYHYDGQHKVL